MGDGRFARRRYTPSQTAVMPMRLDKFLQLTGLVKRRALAKALCEAGRIRLNGKVAKPSSEVHDGDLIDAEIGWEHWQARVTRLPKGSVPSAQRHEFVTILQRQRRDLLSDDAQDPSDSQTFQGIDGRANLLRQ